MLRPIVKFGDRILNDKAAAVDDITPEIDCVIDEMIAAMHAAPGIGLAAPQIGIPLRICVVDLSVGRRPEDLRVMINPAFVERAGTQLEEEGCLSVPGFTSAVVRPRTVIIKGLDLNGKEVTVEGKDLLARAFCHEMDHLNGVFFLDHLSFIKRDIIKRKIRKLVKQGEWER